MKKRTSLMEGETPMYPPSPVIEHLTSEEIEALSDVLQRLENFEREEQERISNMQRDVKLFEENVKKQTCDSSSDTTRLRLTDLRLCRLCFKNKFSDGIGHVCVGCRRRVCESCGSLSTWRLDGKQQAAKARWRCNLCMMRREVAAASGGWFNEGKAQPVISCSSFRQRLDGTLQQQHHQIKRLLDGGEVTQDSQEDDCVFGDPSMRIEYGRLRADRDLDKYKCMKSDSEILGAQNRSYLPLDEDTAEFCAEVNDIGQSAIRHRISNRIRRQSNPTRDDVGGVNGRGRVDEAARYQEENLKQDDDDIDDDDETDEAFLQQRFKCRQQRLQMQQKKTRRKPPRRASVGTCTVEDMIQVTGLQESFIHENIELPHSSALIPSSPNDDLYPSVNHRHPEPESANHTSSRTRRHAPKDRQTVPASPRSKKLESGPRQGDSDEDSPIRQRRRSGQGVKQGPAVNAGRSKQGEGDPKPRRRFSSSDSPHPGPGNKSDSGKGDHNVGSRSRNRSDSSPHLKLGQQSRQSRDRSPRFKVGQLEEESDREIEEVSRSSRVSKEIGRGRVEVNECGMMENFKTKKTVPVLRQIKSSANIKTPQSALVTRSAESRNSSHSPITQPTSLGPSPTHKSSSKSQTGSSENGRTRGAQTRRQHSSSDLNPGGVLSPNRGPQGPTQPLIHISKVKRYSIIEAEEDVNQLPNRDVTSPGAERGDAQFGSSKQLQLPVKVGHSPRMSRKEELLAQFTEKELEDLLRGLQANSAHSHGKAVLPTLDTPPQQLRRASVTGAGVTVVEMMSRTSLLHQNKFIHQVTHSLQEVIPCCRERGRRKSSGSSVGGCVPERRKSSNSSVQSFGSFASSYRDYYRKFSDASCASAFASRRQSTENNIDDDVYFASLTASISGGGVESPGRTGGMLGLAYPSGSPRRRRISDFQTTLEDDDISPSPPGHLRRPSDKNPMPYLPRKSSDPGRLERGPRGSQAEWNEKQRRLSKSSEIEGRGAGRGAGAGEVQGAGAGKSQGEQQQQQQQQHHRRRTSFTAGMDHKKYGVWRSGSHPYSTQRSRNAYHHQMSMRQHLERSIDNRRSLSKSDVLPRFPKADKPRKMSESGVLALIREKSSSKEDSEYSSSIHGAPRRSSAGNEYNVILSRDPTDKRCRTGGLGMMVVGGKDGPDRKLGTFVTRVIKGGPADLAGIMEGDQVLEWDGRSFRDATFEETREMMAQSGDTVQLVLVRHRGGVCSRKHGGSSRRDGYTSHRNVRGSTISRRSVTSREKDLALKELQAKLVQALKEKEKSAENKVGGDSSGSGGRPIKGTLSLTLKYDEPTQCLSLTVIGCEGLEPRVGGGGRKHCPRAYVRINVLPRQSVKEQHRTKISRHSLDPQWNYTCVYENVNKEKIAAFSLLLTVWDGRDIEPDLFLGEVLLDLKALDLSGSSPPLRFPLEAHDLNCGPMPQPPLKYLLVQGTMCTSEDGNGVGAGTDPAGITEGARETLDELMGSSKSLPTTPAHSHVKDFILRSRGNIPVSDAESLNARHSPKYRARGPMRLLGRLKRRVTDLALGAGGSGHPRPSSRPSSLDHQHQQLSTGMINKIDEVPVRYGSAPHSVSGSTTGPVGVASGGLSGKGRRVSGSSSSNCESVKSGGQVGGGASGAQGPGSSETTEDSRLASLERLNRIRESTLEGEDIASMLGPAQVLPKGHTEKWTQGEIKLGFMVSKGQLELDVICAKELPQVCAGQKPDTYVKTSLVGSGRRIQKKRTKTVRSCTEPAYVHKLTYSACNIHGRLLQVLVKLRLGTFERSHCCLGEALIRLDRLDLTSYNTGWYKLFKESSVDFWSSESVNM